VARPLVLALICTLLLSACGSSRSTGDAEESISDQSHQGLSDPECNDAAGEPTFQCSAAEPNGGRIKVLVTFPGPSEESGKAPMILVWPCVPAKTSWKAIRQHPALRCGKPLARYDTSGRDEESSHPGTRQSGTGATITVIRRHGRPPARGQLARRLRRDARTLRREVAANRRG
jgi:hypothetical protein